MHKLISNAKGYFNSIFMESFHTPESHNYQNNPQQKLQQHSPLLTHPHNRIQILNANFPSISPQNPNASENVVQSNKMVTVHYHSGFSFQRCQPEPMLSSSRIHLCWILPSIQNKLVNGWKPNIKPAHCNLCSSPFQCMIHPQPLYVHSVFPFRKSFHIEFTKEWGISEQLVPIEITRKFFHPVGGEGSHALIIKKSCLLFWNMQMDFPANYISDSIVHVPRISTNNPIQ